MDDGRLEMKQDRNSISPKSLVELEGSPVVEPTDTDTPLVQTCLRLMRIPLEQLTTENLRLLIGQHIGLKFLIPLALDRLEPDAFAAGDLYEGDLLYAVVRAPPNFWAAEPQLRSRLDHIVMNLKDRSRFLERDIFPNYERIYGAQVQKSSFSNLKGAMAAAERPLFGNLKC